MEICDEIKTFVMACQATASPWIYYSALYAMAIHPDVQDRLFEEIRYISRASREDGIFQRVYIRSIRLRMYSTPLWVS